MVSLTPARLLPNSHGSRPPDEDQKPRRARRMHLLATAVAYGLYIVILIGAIGLAIVAVFWLPDRLLGFRRAEGVIVVALATIAIWLLLSYVAVPLTGILIVS